MNGRVFILLLAGLFSAPGVLSAADQPWTFWTKTEEKDVPDSAYPGKPQIDTADAVKKKRETQEDLREHAQKALAGADLTTEQGRRDWEKKQKEVRQKRMEELKQEKRAKAVETQKLQKEALEKKRKSSQPGTEAAAPASSPKVKVVEITSASGIEAP